MWDSKFLLLAPIALAGALATPASADTCVGTCGTLGADGVVTESPLTGTYQYVSTTNGLDGVGSLGVGSETNGSTFQSSVFAADIGSSLQFYFNYVTSDGAGFADYGWAALRPESGDDIILFTARTTPDGDTVPGFGLPGLAPGVVLTPSSTPIIPGGPVWSALGGDSGGCYNDGCGYTGWIGMTYTVADAGNYTLIFGVTNWTDTSYATGLAFDGLTIDDTPIGQVPEPTTWAMMLVGFAAIGSAMRRRRTAISFA